ncbi:MAG: alpha/beta hydrolase-fold protein [Deinococcales bacterium]
MTHRRIVGFSLVMCVAICSAAIARSQSATQGVVQTVTVHGASLEGNLLGITADRPVSVYLPPGYNDTTTRYPVVVMLHALGGSGVFFVGSYGFFGGPGQPDFNLRVLADRLITEGTIQPMILVMPDASTPYGACFYANSPVCGNWDDFITEDLVAYVDAHFRTLARPESRAVAGVDVGGYGALVLAMEHPDVYGAAYAVAPLNAAFVDPASNSLYSPDAFAMMEPDRALGLSPAGYMDRVQLGMAAIASPDPERPPYYVDLPVEDVDGQLQQVDAVWQRWRAHTPLQMLPTYSSNLRKLRALGIDVGSGDTEGNTLRNVSALDEALTSAGIAHRFSVYQGTFVGAAVERLGSAALPFLSAALEPGGQ